MGIDSIRKLIKGRAGLPSKSEWNTVIEFIRKLKPKPPKNYNGDYRRRTLMYTAVPIPAFSLFPLRAVSADNTTLYAQYTAQKYIEADKEQYIEGYYATNGKYAIHGSRTFWGYILEDEYDTPLRLSDYSRSTASRTCGFKNNSWSASSEGTGLIMNGATPIDGVYMCRKIYGQSTFEMACAYELPNTDERPEGAFALSDTDTYIYCDALDSFDYQDMSEPPAVYNPLGLPEDRAAIVAVVKGFPGDAEEDPNATESEPGSPVGSLVAISADVREFFTLAGSADNDAVSKGDCYYIDLLEGKWVPTDSTSDTSRLAVCQRDVPAGWLKAFKMPYYTPEMNYGVEPARIAAGQTNAAGSRCGVQPGEHSFTNKRLDYHYKNRRYDYEPVFTFTGPFISGGQIEISGRQFDLTFPTPSAAAKQPDCYSGDTITVEFDADSETATIIECPMDYAVGTIIPTYSGCPGRGWEDVTAEKLNADLGINDLLVLKKKTGWQLVDTDGAVVGSIAKYDDHPDLTKMTKDEISYNFCWCDVGSGYKMTSSQHNDVNYMAPVGNGTDPAHGAAVNVPKIAETTLTFWRKTKSPDMP